MEEKDLTPQERWVLEQVRKGEVADLKEKFGEEDESRCLSARFLENLLTGGKDGLKVHRKGIQIANALIAESLYLENAEVSHTVALVSCIFQEEVNFQDAWFQKHLNLSGTQFRNTVNFQRLKVDKCLFCRSTKFQRTLDLAGAEIGGQFIASGSQFGEQGKEYQAIFNNIKVGQDAFFDGVEFYGSVDFGSSNITGQLAAPGAKFLGQGMDQGANFNGLKVGRSVIFYGAEFHSAVNFGNADIIGQLNARRIRFLGQGPDQGANLNGMKVGKDAFFQGSEFHGPVDSILIRIEGSFYLNPYEKDNLRRATIFKSKVDFGGASIKVQLNAGGAKFLGKGLGQEVSFNSIKVGQDAFFDGAEFHGLVDFGSANINGQLAAPGARFLGQGSGQKASFNGFQVGQNAFFKRVEFQGPVDFGSAEIKGQFIAQAAKFLGQGPDEKANFNGMRVGKDAFLRGAEFHGPVDFTLIRIEGSFYLNPEKKDNLSWSTTFMSGVNFGGASIEVQLNATEAKFLGQEPNQEANFNGLKVGRSAIFKGAEFHGLVNFGSAEIGGLFNARKSRFLSSQEFVFEGLKVARNALFDGALFFGKISLNYAHLYDIFMVDSQIVEMDLERTKIDRELRIKQAKIRRLQASSLEVKGPAILSSLIIEEEADLRDASFQSLDLLQVTWPPDKQKVWLEGLAYQAISAGSNPEAWVALLAWVEGSRFNTQNYSQLEAYFYRCGHRDRADKVFIAGKREGANRLTWGKRWLTRIFWGGLAGYGRKPWQVLYMIFPLVALGTFLFAPEFTAKSLESYSWLKQMKLSHPWVIQFLLSLDRFLPGVDLGLAKEWSPACVGLFTFAYWYFLKLAGWITIPIALAAIYTRIK